MKNIKFLILAVICAFSFSSGAQYTQSSSQNPSFSWSEYAKDSVKLLYECKRYPTFCTTEQKLLLASLEGQVLNHEHLNRILAQDRRQSEFIPLSLDNEELLALAAATSLGVVVFYNDQQITDTVTRNRSSVKETISKVGNFLGEGAFLPIAAGSYFLGVYYKDNRLKQVGLFTVSASLAMGIVTGATKAAFGRKRPNEGQGPYEFWSFGNKSFYSGHTAQAFTIATVIAELYKEDYPVVPWVAYGLATLTAYARVYGEDHWASDVLVGAIAGHLITKWTMNRYKDLTIMPMIDPSRDSYYIVFNWTPGHKDPPLKCLEIESPMLKVDACIAEAIARSSR